MRAAWLQKASVLDMRDERNSLGAQSPSAMPAFAMRARRAR
jgi:hypothetical protein